MLPAPLGPLFSCVLVGACAVAAMAQSPRNVSVTFNGDTDPPAPLAVDAWHAITASYRYPGGVDRLTNTYLVIVRGGDPRTGFYLGYHVPSGELGIVKHGQWNATEATGLPGETGRIIENDQGYMDCEHTVVTQTADDITVAYRVKFKPGVLQGVYSVLMYIEDRDVNYEGFTAMGTVTIDNEGWVHRSDMPARWRNSLTPAGEPVGPLTLAEGGRARYVLALPSAAGRVELKAAGDLARHLQLICGADFATVDESDMPAGTAFISIGRTNLLADAACKFKDADLAEEGYALEVVDGNIYLYGGSGRGLLHGVYSLLEEDLGCRWYSNTSV
ncbi:MAG: hypothetical protein QM446_02425, partial [Synergistota bacterium]|nr:hypothetical protein [Synergistota bacterium]